jgi:hypothetical protein
MLRLAGLNLIAWNFAEGPLMRHFQTQNVVLTLLVVLCAASSAQATGGLSIVVGQHNYSPGTGVVVIPIVVTGNILVHGADLGVQLGGTSHALPPFGFAPLGTAPPITYEGSEQYNNPAPGAGSVVLSPSMWDAHPFSFSDNTDLALPNDNIPTIPGSPGYGTPGREGTWFSLSGEFDSLSTMNGQINPNNGVLVNLVVNLTGFGPGTWALRLDTFFAPTEFVDVNADAVPTNITDGSVTIIPEPTSHVTGLFAVAGLATVAIRKRRTCRYA